MERDPSLHIKKTHLIPILRDLLPKGVSAEVFASRIMQKAKVYSISSRNVTVTNEVMEKKAKKLVSASRYDTDLLAQLVYSTRKKMKHRGISPIKAGGRDWGTLKELTKHALDFTNEFNLTRRYGFLRYIEIGLSKMKKFNLNKFLPMYEGICESYVAQLEIEKDEDSETTKDMYKFYAQKIIENTGLHDPLEDIPERYVWFVRARNQAEKMNISVIIYMKAQFEAFDFSKGIPHPTQLVGPNAAERIVRYCYNHGIKVKKLDDKD